MLLKAALMRALVVDDDDFDRETCRRVLGALAWEVLEAATPEEAIQIIDRDTVDAIITDYDLKASQNGVDVLAHVLKRQPASMRVLMSGLPPQDVLGPAQLRGEVQSHFEKPDTLEEWQDALKTILPQNKMVNGPTVHANGAQTRASGSTRTEPPEEAEETETDRSREDRLEERVRWMNAVVDLGTIAHSGAGLQETFDQAVQVVSRMLGMEYVKILKLLPDGKEVLLVAGVGWKPGLVGNARVSTGMDSQAGYTLASEHPVIAEDLRAETRFSGPSLLHEHGVVSGLSVTIPGENGRSWGVMGAHTKGRRRLTHDHALFLRGVANVVAGAILRDRTEETLRSTKSVLEREVTERTRELRVAVDDLQAFNAMVAHDLRAPLRTVNQALDLIRHDHGDRLDPEVVRLMDMMGKSTVQMRDLLEDLLTFAKATQDPLEMVDIDVSALARERWSVVAQREPERSVGFHVQEGLAAHADPRFLSIVLDNLLGNAFKFTRPNEDAQVELGKVHLPQGGTAFYIRDNGAGFPTDRASRLFYPFQRLHSAKEFEGTGIGLATVRRIVERHKGSVWAESAGPGEGATFYFRLLPPGLP